MGSCVPGDVVTVYGVVRCMPTSGGMGGGGERQAPNKSLYILYLEVKAECHGGFLCDLGRGEPAA